MGYCNSWEQAGSSPGPEHLSRELPPGNYLRENLSRELPGEGRSFPVKKGPLPSHLFPGIAVTQRNDVKTKILNITVCPSTSDCELTCIWGRMYDPSGCRSCHCNPPPRPVCPHCNRYCEYGMKKGRDGCPQCVCNEEPHYCKVFHY